MQNATFVGILQCDFVVVESDRHFRKGNNMVLNQIVSGILQTAESKILSAIQDQIGNETGWISVIDEDGNDNLPTDERQVLVFLWGGQGEDSIRPNDAGYGLRMGYFDQEKRYWRVHGTIEKYVTHWRECPNDPPNSVYTFKA